MSKTVKISNIKKAVKEKLEIRELGLEVKPCLSFREKLRLRDTIVAGSTIETSGIKKIDYLLKQIHTDMYLVKFYTNVDFSTVDSIADSDEYNDKFIELYELLRESNIIEHTYEQIVEIDEVLEVIEDEIAQVERMGADLAVVLGTALNKFIDGIPKSPEAIQAMKSAVDELVASQGLGVIQNVGEMLK